MFDIGWLELIVIGIVALIVVGPKDLPGMFRTVGRFMGKARGMAREFQRAMEQAADESGLKEAASSLNTIKDPLAQARASAKSYSDNFLKDRDEKAKGKDKDIADKGGVDQVAADAAEMEADLAEAEADTVLSDPGQVQEPEPPKSDGAKS